MNSCITQPVVKVRNFGWAATSLVVFNLFNRAEISPDYKTMRALFLRLITLELSDHVSRDHFVKIKQISKLVAKFTS